MPAMRPAGRIRPVGMGIVGRRSSLPLPKLGTALPRAKTAHRLSCRRSERFSWHDLCDRRRHDAWLGPGWRAYGLTAHCAALHWRRRFRGCRRARKPQTRRLVALGLGGSLTVRRSQSASFATSPCFTCTLPSGDREIILGRLPYSHGRRRGACSHRDPPCNGPELRYGEPSGSA